METLTIISKSLIVAGISTILISVHYNSLNAAVEDTLSKKHLIIIDKYKLTTKENTKIINLKKSKMKTKDFYKNAMFKHNYELLIKNAKTKEQKEKNKKKLNQLLE